MNARDRARLEYVLREMEFISGRVRGVSWQQFSTDEMLQRALTMTLLNVGETAKRLSDEFLQEHADMQWRKIISIRNVAAHGYESLRMDIIWQTLTIDIAKLREQITAII